MATFFLQFLLELVDKKSYTRPKTKSHSHSPVVYVMDVRALLSDFVLLLTDYDPDTPEDDFVLLHAPSDNEEDDEDDGEGLEHSPLPHSKTLRPQKKGVGKTEEEMYLERFHGIVLSLENASL